MSYFTHFKFIKMKLLSIFMFVFCSISFGQNKKVIDSLIEITLNSKIDSVKIDNYEKLINFYWNINNDTAKIYNEKLKKIAIKLNDKKSILSSKIYEATFYANTGNYDKADKHFANVLKEIQSDKYVKKDKLLAIYHYNYGNYCLSKNLTDLALINYNKGVEYYSKLKINKNVARIKLNIGFIYGKKNEFLKSTNIYLSALPDLIMAKDWLGLSAAYGRIGFNYGILNMHLKAIEYHKLGLEIDKKNNFINNKAYAFLNIGSEYADMKQFQKAKNNFIKSKEIFSKINDTYMELSVDLSLILIDINEDKVNKSLKKLLEIESKNIATDENLVILLHSIGTCYYKLNKYDSSEKFLYRALQLTILNNYPNKSIEISHDYLFSRLKNNDDILSIESFKLYDSLSKIKNSDDNKIAFFNVEQKYHTVEKEAKIKTQQLQLEKEKTNKYIAFGGIGLLILLSLGGYIFYRNRQNQKEKLLKFEIDNLNNNINLMEMQNLNQQLDPHELDNFIQIVSKKVIRQDERLYNQLINLWNVTNIVLNHKELTSDIKTEIENLEKFLIYQQEIIYPKFEFNITNDLSDENFKIPRLLLRNLTGNAIKHGLKGMEGKIDIEIFEKDDKVNIYVQDNGRGFDKENLKKGIGTSTYENIFAKLNLKNKEKATIEFMNIEQGVLVKVCIPKNYNFIN